MSIIKISEMTQAAELTQVDAVPIVNNGITKKTLLGGLADWVLKTYAGFLPAGAGAVSRTMQDKSRERVSVKDFGAVGNGVANDSGAIQAALTYAGTLPNGGVVEGGAGVFLGMATPVTIPSGVTLDLRGTTLTPLSIMPGAMINTTSGYIDVIGGSFNNQASMAPAAIGVSKARDNDPISISKCYFGGFNNRAIEVVSGSNITIENNIVVNCGTAFDLSGVVNCYIRDNYVLGSNGVRLGYLGLSNEGIDISGNKFLPATATYAVAIFQCFEVTMSNNIFDQIITGDAVILDGATAFIDTVKLRDNFIGRQSLAASANYGVYAFGSVRNLLSSGNTYVGWRQAGIYINGDVTNTIEEFCSRDDTFYVEDPCVADIKIEYCRGAIIDGANFNATVHNIDEGLGVEGTVINCRFNANRPPIDKGLRYGSQAAAMYLKNRGTVTINAAGVAAVVPHGLSYTPDLSSISLIYGSSATTDPSPMRIVNLNATDFTIAPNVAPGSDVTVGWAVDMTR